MDEKKMMERQKLYREVVDLFEEVSTFDDIVGEYFDLDSERMLPKKKRVLQALVDGKTREEIGRDYLEVLENLKIPDGSVVMLGGEEIDPRDFK